ncbi:MAG: HEAT repeat domain-containing protein [Myxococcota bacterium]|nr:HEAT repeat domain-containing protein [Myxococcota bacterium]
MGTSLDDFLTAELSGERVAEVVAGKALDPVALIEQHLFDGRTFLRRNAALALTRIGPVEVDNLHWVVVATKDADPVVREYTIAALPTLGMTPHAAFASLVATLGDRATSVALAAAAALEQLTLADPEVLADLLVARLTDTRPGVGATVQALLLRIAPQAAPRLVAACAGEDRGLAAAAASTLGRLGASAQDALIGGLSAVRGRRLLVGLLDDLPAAEGAGKKALEAQAAQDEDPALATLARRLLDKPPAPEPPGPLVYPSETFTEVLAEAKALDALKKSGPDVSSLLRGLGDSRATLRANCAALLGRLPADEGTATAVAALVRDEEVLVRAATAEALGPLGGAEALLIALGDEDEGVREAAAKALGSLPATAVARLSAAAGRASDSVQSAVLVGLAARGKDAVPGLRATLTEAPTIPSRAFAALALAGLANSQSAAVDALVLGLADESGDVQAAAAMGLVRIGTSASDEVKQAVRGAFGDTTHDAVLRACSRALDAFAGREIPPLTREAPTLPLKGFDTEALDEAALQKAAKGSDVEALDALLTDGRSLVRLNALGALVHLGDAASPALGGVLLCLKDATPRVRVAAAKSLSQLQLEPFQALPALAHARDGASAALAEAIDAAILAYGDAAVPPLMGLVGSRASVEEVAFAGLASLGAPAAKALVALLSSDALVLRVAAARGLGRFGARAGKAARQALSKAFDAAEETEVLRACSAALDAIDGKVPPPAVADERTLPADGFAAEVLGDDVLKKAAASLDVARLGELLFDGREMCRVNAARSLGHVGRGAEAYAGALVVALKDSEPEVRVAAAEALGRLKGDASVVVPGLASAAGRDRSDVVREAALVALDAHGADAVTPILGLLDREARHAAVVGEVAARAPTVYLAPLREALTERESPRAKENAAMAIARLGAAGAPASDALLSVMGASDVPLKCVVIRALGEVAKPQKALIDSLQACAVADERLSVEAAVRDALRALGRRTRG